MSPSPITSNQANNQEVNVTLSSPVKTTPDGAYLDILRKVAALRLENRELQKELDGNSLRLSELETSVKTMRNHLHESYKLEQSQKTPSTSTSAVAFQRPAIFHTQLNAELMELDKKPKSDSPQIKDEDYLKLSQNQAQSLLARTDTSAIIQKNKLLSQKSSNTTPIKTSQRDSNRSFDQPVNYSTRFDESGISPNKPAKLFHETSVSMVTDTTSFPSFYEHLPNNDTVQTFCTEGTPIDFLSTCNSPDNQTNSEITNRGVQAKNTYDQFHEPPANHNKSIDELKNYSCEFLEVDHVEPTSSIKRLSVSQNLQNPASNSCQLYDIDSTGVFEGDKTKRYCVEDTPNCLSLATSPRNTLQPDVSSHDESVHDESSHLQPDVQETPMMFSRSSSLSSLNGCDVHSVHSTVVSEYSQRVSGAVSPSDLPDSPGDPLPTISKINQRPSLIDSPQLKHLQVSSKNEDLISLEIYRRSDSEGSAKLFPVQSTPHKNSCARNLGSFLTVDHNQSGVQSRSESPRVYAVEDTPLKGLSQATSLSDLSINDSDLSINDDNSPSSKSHDSDTFQVEGVSDMLYESSLSSLSCESVVDPNCSDEDEALLDECISSAMPVSKKHRSSRQKAARSLSVDKSID